VTDRPTAAELLATAGALLDRRALAELGLQRRTIDHIFRVLPVVSYPDVRRVYIRAEDYLAYEAQHTYAKDQVRPT
jgi:hypothetical protein